jgi:hypothetical protein
VIKEQPRQLQHGHLSLKMVHAFLLSQHIEEKRPLDQEVNFMGARRQVNSNSFASALVT